MAKRGADFQMTKDNAAIPDFGFGTGAVGGIQPQRATAQQMAKRKIATGKRTRVAGSGAPGPSEQQSTFSFGSMPQTNGWEGAFGATSTSFGSSMNQPTAAASQNNSVFGAAPPSINFGTNSAQPTSTPPVNFNFSATSANSSPFQPFGTSNDQTKPAASTNSFSFPALNNSSPNPSFGATSTTSQSSSAPAFSFSKPTSNAQGFGSTALSTSAAEQPKNPFFAASSAAPSFSGFTPAKPAERASASPAPPTIHTMTVQETDRVRRFLKDIEPKYPSVDAFKVDTRAQIEQLSRDGKVGSLLDGTSTEQQTDTFATEIQELQKRLANAADQSSATFPEGLYVVLSAMVDKQLGPAVAAPSTNLFQPSQSASQSAASPFSFSQSTTKPAEATTPNVFQTPKPAFSFSSSSNPSSTFSMSSTAQQPTQEQVTPASTMSPADFRALIIDRVIEKLSSTKSSTSDTIHQLRDVLTEALNTHLPTLTSENIPMGMTAEQLQKAVIEAVEHAQKQINAANTQTAKDAAHQAVMAALPQISSAIRSATATVRRPEPQIGAAQPTVDPLPEFERIERECEVAMPPDRVPGLNVTFQELPISQRDTIICAHRIKLLNKAIAQLLESLWLQPLAESKLEQEYDRLVTSWLRQAGTKNHTLVGAAGVSVFGNGLHGANGVNANPAFDKPSFGTPSTNHKRSADDVEIDSTAKRARGENNTPVASPGTSQTSQLFASIAGSTSKPSTSTTASSNIFGATTGNASNIFNNTDPASKTSLFAAAASFTPSKVVGSQQEAASKSGSSTDNLSKNTSGITGFKPTLPAAASGAVDFMSQFSKKAAETEAKEKAKRKLEDFDSDEETEEEWEKRDAEEQAVKRQKFKEAAQSAQGFVPSIGTNDSASEAGKGNEADNEASDEDGDGEEQLDVDRDQADQEDAESVEEDSSSQLASGLMGTPTPSRNLFDRVQKPAGAASSKLDDSPGADKTWKPDTPIKFGNANSPNAFSASTTKSASTSLFAPSGNTPAASSSIFGSTTASEAPKNPFGSFNASPKAPSLVNPFTNVAKTDSSEKNGAAGSAPSASQPTFNFISASPQKDKTSDGAKNLFVNSNSSEPPKSLFGATTSKPFENPFAKLAKPGSLPQFNATEPSSNSLAPTSIFATATSSRATSPGMTTGDESTGSGAGDEATGNDPQLDLSGARSGEENDECLFEVKAKASELVKGGEGGDAAGAEWVVRGVGQLRLLQNTSTRKCRLLLRAGPASRVVLNSGLIPTTSYARPTPKSVSFLASNSGRLGKWTLQTGKEEDAKKLFELLEKHKRD